MIIKSSIQKRTTKAASLNQVKLFGKFISFSIDFYLTISKIEIKIIAKSTILFIWFVWIYPN